MCNFFHTRSVLAGFLLCVFSLAITPKRLFHNLMANHKDTYAKSSENGQTQLAKAGINCPCDNLVAISPFDETGQMPDLQAPLFFSDYREYYAYAYIYSISFFFELRGPPAHSAV